MARPPNPRTPARALADGSVQFGLSDGRLAVVSHEDADLAELAWSASGPYARRRCGSGWTYLHQVVARRVGLDGTDHVDRDGLNNRRSNLRAATPSQQQINQGRSAKNTSGRIGVSRRPSGRWVARHQHAGQYVTIGTFDTVDEAGDAYDAHVTSIHGEFAENRR